MIATVVIRREAGGSIRYVRYSGRKRTHDIRAEGEPLIAANVEHFRADPTGFYKAHGLDAVPAAS